MVLRIGAKRVNVAEQGDSHGPTGLRQLGSHHETIAAIVARSAQYAQGPRRKAALDLAGHGIARVLHEKHARRAGRHRQAIGFIHLRHAEQRAAHSRPTAAPTPVVTAIASALQKATRSAPVRTLAPPTCADQPPRNSRQARQAPAMAAIKYCAGAISTTVTGSVAPMEKLPAEARAACNGRALELGEMPNSSRAWDPKASCAISWSATLPANAASTPRRM